MIYGSLDVIESAVSGVDGPTIARLFLPHPPLAAQRVCGETPPRRQSVTVSLWGWMSTGRPWGVEDLTAWMRPSSRAPVAGRTFCRAFPMVPCLSHWLAIGSPVPWFDPWPGYTGPRGGRTRGAGDPSGSRVPGPHAPRCAATRTRRM